MRVKIIAYTSEYYIWLRDNCNDLESFTELTAIIEFKRSALHRGLTDNFLSRPKPR